MSAIFLSQWRSHRIVQIVISHMVLVTGQPARFHVVTLIENEFQFRIQLADTGDRRQVFPRL
jgi:hypothetical protein